MADKKAFVFDTNFIIQNPKLDEVIEKLKDEYSVYVSQVSIDERIAQQCRELKEKFDEIEQCRSKYAQYVNIKLKTTYSEQVTIYQLGIQEKYASYFGQNIIPFNKDGKTLETIIARANQKEPPFAIDKNASDKGFKDCLLWLSLLEYFKNNGEKEVIFVTDDKNAFKNHTDFLTKEFEDVTGKHIEIQPNSFYKDSLKKKEEVIIQNNENALPDVSQLRDRIQSVLELLCYVEGYDYWGNQTLYKTFLTSQKFDAEYMQKVFEGLGYDIEQYIFEKTVSATKILGWDDRISDGEVNIPMSAIEEAKKLHDEILKKYPDYVQQFYSTAANILNCNFAEPQLTMDKDDDLPF